MQKVNLADKFAKISEYWKPYIAAELNGQHVKLDKLKGEFVFHHHEHEDEMFLVVKGRFRMEFLDRYEWIEEGEFIVVPRGVEHRPVADLFARVVRHHLRKDARTVPAAQTSRTRAEGKRAGVVRHRRGRDVTRAFGRPIWRRPCGSGWWTSCICT